MGNRITTTTTTTGTTKSLQASAEDQEPVKPNVYYKKIEKLPTLHSSSMHEKKKYQISLYKSGLAGYHDIIVSDQRNEDIIFTLRAKNQKSTLGQLTGNWLGPLILLQIAGSTEYVIKSTLTFIGGITGNLLGDFTQSLISPVQAKPKCEVFMGEKSALTPMGTTETTLYKLTVTAAKIFSSNPHYHPLWNNSQNFCQKFLKETTSETYKTDMDIVQEAIYKATDGINKFFTPPAPLYPTEHRRLFPKNPLMW